MTDFDKVNFIHYPWNPPGSKNIWELVDFFKYDLLDYDFLDSSSLQAMAINDSKTS